MKTEGLDHVTIGVKNLDKAMEFFSRVLGIEFVELTGALPEAAGFRAGMSADSQIELVSPVLPLKDEAFPQLKRLAKLLEGKNSVVFALAFRVKDAEEIVADAGRKGIRIENRFDVEEFEALPVRNLKEILTKDEDTLGIDMKFVEYELS